MNPQNFNRILSSASALDQARTRELDIIVEEYPYFQAARALQLKGLYQHQSFLYNSALKKTAVYTADRSVLFDYITSAEFQQHYISEKIKKRHEEDRLEEIEETELMSKEDAEKILDPELFEESIIEEEKSEKEEKVKEKPVEFDAQEERTFSEWLKLTKAKPIEREKETQNLKPNHNKEQEIIQKFIENEPKIKPSKNFNKKISMKDYQPDSPLMTETLAEIYAKQKNYSKAIQAYKILVLKNPKKSGLFADRIQEIENLIETKNK